MSKIKFYFLGLTPLLFIQLSFVHHFACTFAVRNRIENVANNRGEAKHPR
jgi:hypothetical protein